MEVGDELVIETIVVEFTTMHDRERISVRGHGKRTFGNGAL
jgi:hypothetical protein